MTEENEIPEPVRVALRAYRDATWAARAAYQQQRLAATRGDESAVSAIEKERPDRMLTVDRARVELDEAVRQW